MAATPLTYHGLPSGSGDGNGARLQLTTPNGTIREVPLTRADVMRILAASVRCLEQLDADQRRNDRQAAIEDVKLNGPMHEGDILTDTVDCGLPRRDVRWSSVTTRTTCQDCIEARK